VLEECRSHGDAALVIRRCREYEAGTVTFVAGTEAMAREHAPHEALLRKAANAARRGEFVERMRAKAIKEGRDSEFYLRAGREPPSPSDVHEACKMSKEVQTRWWRERFGQHCQGHHLLGKCPHLGDPRGCGFLHGKEEDTAHGTRQ
jgi:hypothetical protein